MGQVFAALLKKLAPAQQAALKADQKSWLTGRDGGCFEKKDAELTQCLLAATRGATVFPRRRGGQRPGRRAAAVARLSMPKSKKGAYDITIALSAIRQTRRAEIQRGGA